MFDPDSIAEERITQEASQAYLRQVNPTTGQLIEAFPAEIMFIVPREIRRLKGIVREYEAKQKNIRNRHYDLLKEMVALMWLKIFDEPKEEIKLLKDLQNILDQKNNPNKNEGITPAMISKAKAYPILAMYNFDKIINGGGRIKVCCPFHKENTPSMVIYKANTWHCFGCGLGRDAVDFYMKLHGVNFPTAVRRLNSS